MPWSLRSAPMFGWVMAGLYVFTGHRSGQDQ